MRRVFLTCVAAIALLTGASAALILWTTRDPPPGAVADLPAQGAPEAEPLTHPSPPAPDDAGRVSAFEAGPGDLGELGVHALPPPLAPPPGPRLSAPMARPALRTGEHRAPPAPTPQRRAALAGFRRELIVGISRLQQHVSGCASQGATFDLSLESVAGGVKVVSATVASRGAATEAALSCAQSALRGQLIPASTQSGRQWRMPLVVR